MGLFKWQEDINDMFNNPQKRAMLEEGVKLLNEINDNQREILKELKEINNKLNFIEKLQVLYNEYRFFGEHYPETNAKYSLITGELLK